MKFEKYEHINNLNHKRTLDKFFYGGHLLDSVKWCVTEKVHGAHFDIACDYLGLVEFWSRKRKIPAKVNFRNYDRIRDHLAQCITDLYSLIERDTGTTGFNLIVCGEIFGANYPHKDVKSLNLKRIQKGVYYCPDVNFYAYDIKINGWFVNYYAAVALLNEAGFFTAEILRIGTFRECMKYSNKFQTKLPLWLILPEIEDNICEGIVLKPIIPSRCFDGTRVIFKSKNEIYDERQKAPKVPREPIVLSDEANKTYNLLSIYITPQRLDNVLSKINTELLSKKTGFGKIMGDFRKDVMKSFDEDYDGIMKSLSKEDKIIVIKQIGKLCIPLVKKEWMQIIE